MTFNLTPRLDRALRLASYSHDKGNHYRKGELRIPYIMHPFAVMSMLTNVTSNEDVLIAALLHDTLEDLNPSIISEQDIKEAFGDEVLFLIKSVSKDPAINDWRESNEDYIRRLVDSNSTGAMLVSLGDKTHNLFSTLLDYERIGNKVWERFSTKNKADQVWWYTKLEEVFRQHLEPSPLLEQYQGYVERLRAL